jgi:hypothetical protein
MIPDTQVHKGTPAIHLQWIGRYIVDKKPDVIICIGDWYDMPSLSFFDRGKKAFEGRRFNKDIDAGHRALDIMMKPMNDYNAMRAKNKQKQYKPEMHVTWGNHEYRINRAVEDKPELDGIVGQWMIDEYWQERGWQTHNYGEVIDIDGVWYTHVLFNELTGRPQGGMAATMLKTIGHTFTMGHRQVYDLATRYVGTRMHRALIAGACYLHDESYKGPPREQTVRGGNYHWRGCLMKHDVVDGEYSLMELPLDYFCRRYEGKPLAKFRGQYRITA